MTLNDLYILVENGSPRRYVSFVNKSAGYITEYIFTNYLAFACIFPNKETAERYNEGNYKVVHLSDLIHAI